ncbi:hypothetical protein QOM21_23935 [Streptomyces sp. Pv4-95]|uniref:hypothetical protein n=1 Tax=Streptomyces sp. Pv4-95 TaxID=3049543 RepID=UPI003892A11C
MSQEPEARPDIQEAMDKLRALRATIESVGKAARDGIRAFDRFQIADHPDLNDLNHSMDNLYGNGFD